MYGRKTKGNIFCKSCYNGKEGRGTMKNRWLFIVVNDEIKFMLDDGTDHKEWYQSLGGDMAEYDNVIRGYVMEGKIIYFKANLNYDGEVIEFATKTGIKMKQQLNDNSLKVCCGIEPGRDGAKWEPILVLKDEDLDGYQSEEEIQKAIEDEEKKKMIESLKDENAKPIVEFKNDEDDPRFIKLATTFTLVMIGLAFLSKLFLIHNRTMQMSNRWNSLLVIGQFGGFVLTFVGYRTKTSKTKLFAFISSVASIFMFDFIDIIIGILTALFTMDHKLVLKMLDGAKVVGNHLREFIRELTTKNGSGSPTMKSPVVPTTLPPETEESANTSTLPPTMSSPVVPTTLPEDVPSSNAPQSVNEELPDN